VIALVLVLGSALPTASAQDEPTPEVRADLLNEEARLALERREFAEARDLLERSLEIHPTARAAFNLARVFREQGSPTRALEYVDALNEGRYGPLPPEREAQLRTIEADARGDLAHLTVAIAGARSMELRVDGEPSGAVTDPRTLVLDPGMHRVLGSTPDGRTFEESVDLARGERTRITLGSAPVVVTPVGTPDDTSDGGGTVFESPWFWLVLGTVVIGGGVALVLLLDATEGPLENPRFGRVETLSAP
jgi:hypothetical protein